ncbi:MAG TPA: hypothetical protein VEU97_12170 [Ktedonobacteraceae bacterium]|nr:hypothetical protein [Ktedonobacteraceae bacterium]
MFILLASRRWGLIIIGILLLAGGLIYGTTSHQSSYSRVSQGTIAHILSGNGTGYLQMKDSSTLYVINQSDFSPAVTDNTFSDGDTITFVYSPDKTSDINVSATNSSTQMQGTGYTVEQITLTSDPGGQKVFTTSDYAKNPNGYYSNNWTVGGIIAALGLLLAGLGLLNRGKKQNLYSTDQPPFMGAPGQAGPYQQPYQNPPMYPQYNPAQYPQQQPGQYPPNPGQYGQPMQSNPYAPQQNEKPYNQPPGY